MSLNVYIQGLGSASADDLNTFMQTCDNVAQLRTFTGISAINVYARGTSAIADGGQGVFYWNANSLGPDNGVTVIVPSGASQGAWIKIPQGSDPAYAYAALPTPTTPYLRVFCTDSTTTTFNATITVGGGANLVPAFSDGTNWRVG